jgi:hypothetical protein
MPYTYLSIDSRHAQYHETASEMTVHLSAPILHAKSVRLVSFSQANEYYNIYSGANTLTFKAYRLTDNVSETLTITVPPGLYSISDLVTFINNQTPTFFSISLSFAQLAGGKVTITATSATSPAKRMILFHPRFYNSLAYRLGFAREQVSDSFANNLIQGPTGSATINYKGVSTPESEWDETALFAIWNPSSAVAADQVRTSNFIGFESRCPNLYVHSDLVRDFHTTMHDEANDMLLTSQQNVMQKIDLNVGIYSYVHYRSSLTEAFTHSLSGQAITSFKISLRDDQHKLFEARTYKPWSCVLVFETVDDEAAIRINEQVISDNQRRRFLAEHRC